MFQSTAAVRKDTEAMKLSFEKKKARHAINTRDGRETNDVWKDNIGSHVLVYRPEIENWDGTFALIDIKGETSTIIITHLPISFRTTVIKRYLVI